MHRPLSGQASVRSAGDVFHINTGEWQWPFSEQNLGLSSPIAQVLLDEVSSLEVEMDMVAGERPRL